MLYSLIHDNVMIEVGSVLSFIMQFHRDALVCCSMLKILKLMSQGFILVFM